MKRDAQTASDLLSVGLSTEAESLPRLKVMADPQWKGKHPYHDARWIVTEDAEVEWSHKYGTDEWRLSEGSAVAQMRDHEQQAKYARLFAAAPELLRVLQRLAEKVRRANGIQHSGGKIDSDDWSELYALQGEAFAAIQRATVAQ